MQCIAVRCGSGTYAFRAELVREITTPGRLTRLPGAPGHVLGLQNVRGLLVTVIDLGARLTGTPCGAAEPTVLVLQADGRQLGVLADEVLEVFVLDDFAESVSGAVPSGGLVSSVGHFGAVVVMVIDAQELVRQSLA